MTATTHNGHDTAAAANPFDDGQAGAVYLDGLHHIATIRAALERAGERSLPTREHRLADVLTAEGYSMVEAFCSRVGLGLPDCFAEAEALPVEALPPGCEIPTRAEVRRHCRAAGVRDPHEVVTEAEAAKAAADREAKAQRSTDPAAAARALFAGPPLAFTGGPLPLFPLHTLPPEYREYAEAVAMFTQTDPAMAAMTLLGTIAAVTQRCAEIEIRRGWRETLSLYVMTVARPSERKSPVFSAIAGPVLDAEEEIVRAATLRRIEAEARDEVAKAKAKATAKAATDAAGKLATMTADDDEAATARQDAEREVERLTEVAIEAAQEADKVRVPPIPRLRADDVTAETLASRMAENDERMAIMSSEGGFFDTLAGRYSGGVANLDLVLKAYSGDSARIDRSGGRSEKIDRPALTIVCTVQPLVLDKIMTNETFLRSGFLARFMFANPPSMLGHRRVDPPGVDALVEAGYKARLIELATTLSERYTANRRTADEVVVLRLTRGAADLISELAKRIEPRLAEGADLDESGLGDWAGKHVGRVGRIAAALHFGRHGPSGAEREVEAATMADAVKIGEFLLHHAAAAYSAAPSGDASLARAFLAKLTARVAATGVYSHPRSEITKRLPDSLRRADPAKVEAALALLERLHWVVVERYRPAGGGRERVTLTLNPDGVIEGSGVPG